MIYIYFFSFFMENLTQENSLKFKFQFPPNKPNIRELIKLMHSSIFLFKGWIKHYKKHPKLSQSFNDNYQWEAFGQLLELENFSLHTS